MGRGARHRDQGIELDDGFAQTIRGAVQARREDAVSLLQELVRVPSVTGEEGVVGAVGIGAGLEHAGHDRRPGLLGGIFVLSALIGSISFAGSMIAFSKRTSFFPSLPSTSISSASVATGNSLRTDKAGVILAATFILPPPSTPRAPLR